MNKILFHLVLVASSLALAPPEPRTPGRVDPGPIAAADEPVKFPIAPVDPAPLPIVPTPPDPFANLVRDPVLPPPVPAPVPPKVNMGGCACQCGCPRCNCPADGVRAVRQPAPAAPVYSYRTDNGGQVWHDTDAANLDRWVALRNAQLAAATPYAQSATQPRYPVLYRGFGNGPIFGGGMSAGGCAGGSCR